MKEEVWRVVNAGLTSSKGKPEGAESFERRRQDESRGKGGVVAPVACRRKKGGTEGLKGGAVRLDTFGRKRFARGGGVKEI